MKIISVVGNAKSIFDSENGSLIDSADLIIRFNRGASIDKVSQGEKTNILVFTNPGSKTAFPGGLEYWDTNNFPERAELEKMLGARPSNGIIALEKIKNDYPDADVMVFGFDWKETQSFWKPDRPKTKHDYKKEKEYCLSLIKENNWELYK